MAAVQTPIVGGMFYTMLGDAIFTHLRLQGTERTTSAGSSAYSMLRETQRTPAAQEFQQSPAPPAACRIGPAHPATYARALRPPDRLCTGTVIDFRVDEADFDESKLPREANVSGSWNRISARIGNALVLHEGRSSTDALP